MKYLSVCSGIEAASVAWHPLGWEPLAFSEIEPFPRKVLAHHYPNVPCHGDFTVLRHESWIKDADVLVGGTPCQAFSVAGLRQSLADDRGNLTLEFVRLANAIDDLRSDPAVIIWENVPGVLSVSDNAFGCFLAALVGNDTPLLPTGGKWTNAGMVIGPQRSAAWRILDAQYFGVAQRRRRVFVVASAREGFDPAEVLFEREGLRRDTAPRREEREKAAGPATEGSGNGCASGSLSHWDGDQYPHPTLNQSSKSSGGVGASNQEIFSQRGACLAPHKGSVGVLANCFGRQRSDQYGETSIASTMSARDFKSATDLVATGFYPTAGQDFPSLKELSPAVKVGSGGSSGNPPGAQYGASVRRLTPRECERLQGFPDDYTAIPNAADGPRYKALGNSMAVPVMHWIGKRIQKKVLVRPDE